MEMINDVGAQTKGSKDRMLNAYLTNHFHMCLHLLFDLLQGRLHKGGMVRDAPWRKLGGCCDDKDAFARVYNNLLLYEYI